MVACLFACSLHVRLGLKECLEKANNDPSVESIVISGEKKFLGGADIKEFSTFSTATSGKFSTAKHGKFSTAKSGKFSTAKSVKVSAVYKTCSSCKLFVSHSPSKL